MGEMLIVKSESKEECLDKRLFTLIDRDCEVTVLRRKKIKIVKPTDVWISYTVVLLAGEPNLKSTRLATCAD